jgi:hypothetical protein
MSGVAYKFRSNSPREAALQALRSRIPVAQPLRPKPRKLQKPFLGFVTAPAGMVLGFDCDTDVVVDVISCSERVVDASARLAPAFARVSVGAAPGGLTLLSCMGAEGDADLRTC